VRYTAEQEDTSSPLAQNSRRKCPQNCLKESQKYYLKSAGIYFEIFLRRARRGRDFMFGGGETANLCCLLALEEKKRRNKISGANVSRQWPDKSSISGLLKDSFVRKLLQLQTY
jgi:hypothetical protein